jgi:hypothetical protein
VLERNAGLAADIAREVAAAAVPEAEREASGRHEA